MPPSRPLPRGFLVALEGIDGTGKSTQVARLTAALSAQGYDVVALREPTSSPWGRRLRETMTTGQRLATPSQALELFLQDRRYDVAAHIKPALAARRLVLMDRYYFSNMAYQGALGIDPEMIRRLNESFAPIPDLVILLLIAPAQALERIRRGRGPKPDHFEREDYLKRVDAVYRSLQGPHIHPIAAEQPLEALTRTIQQKILALLSACSPVHPSLPAGRG